MMGNLSTDEYRERDPEEPRLFIRTFSITTNMERRVISYEGYSFETNPWGVVEPTLKESWYDVRLRRLV